MNIAIMTDSHNNWKALEQAVQIANEHKCEYLLFAGDLTTSPGIKILNRFNGKVKFIWGNDENDKPDINNLVKDTTNIDLCGDLFEETIDNIKIFMTHHPRFVELAAKSGAFDLCIHGDTHIFRNDIVDGTILLNPGSLKKEKCGFVIFNTKTKDIDEFSL